MKIKYRILCHFPRLLRLPISTSSSLLGEIGERCAATYLRRHGYRIVERNYRPYKNEIDIIARKRSGIYFVEVKTRSVHKDSPYYKSPAESVTSQQMHNIRSAAKTYIASSKFAECFFGIAEVYVTERKGAKVVSDIKFITGLSLS